MIATADDPTCGLAALPSPVWTAARRFLWGYDPAAAPSVCVFASEADARDMGPGWRVQGPWELAPDRVEDLAARLQALLDDVSYNGTPRSRETVEILLDREGMG